MSSKKLPAFQFYPGDWMKDPNLRMCSPAARGVWMDILCLMHEAENRGELDCSTPDLAHAISGDNDTIQKAIDELIRKRVLKTKEGVLYSSRMVRDEEIRHAKVESGRSGGLAKAKRKAITPPSKQASETLAKPRSSSSSSSSSSTSIDKDRLAFDSDAFKNAWGDWKTYRKEIRHALTPSTIKQQMKKFVKMGEARAIASIYHTIGQGWTGLQEPDKPASTRASPQSKHDQTQADNAAYCNDPSNFNEKESA